MLNDIAPYVTLTAFFTFASLAGILAYRTALIGTKRIVKEKFEEHLAAMHTTKEELIVELQKEISTVSTKD